MKGITFVLAILDMSGSMGTLAGDVRDGFNEFINGLRADEHGVYRVTAVVFDDRYEPLCVAAPLENVPRLDGKNYQPRGMTALYDAVGRTIDAFEESAQVGEADRVILFVSTDGHENYSTRYTAAAVAKLITDRQATGRWDCKYIGAHADAWGQAQQMGFLHTNTVTSSHTSAGYRGTYRGMTASASAFAAGASSMETTDFLEVAIANEEAKENQG